MVPQLCFETVLIGRLPVNLPLCQELCPELPWLLVCFSCKIPYDDVVDK